MLPRQFMDQPTRQDAFALLMNAGRRQAPDTKKQLQQQQQQQQQQQRKRSSTSASPQLKRQRSQGSEQSPPTQHSLQAATSQCNLSNGLSQQHQHHGTEQQLATSPQQVTVNAFGTQTESRTAQAPSKEAGNDADGQTASLPCTGATAAATPPAAVDKQAAVDAFKRAFSGGLSSNRKPAPQKFDYLLVYDFEATTNKARTLHPIEIVELSCAIVNTATASITASYQSFVRPTEHPILDPFAIELCGIQQSQVDAAPLLADVLQHHHTWLQEQGVLADGVSCVPVTWTEWDLKVALCQECGWRRIQRPDYLCRWVDLKQHFKAKYKKAGNLKTCVEKAGLTWQGRAHSGIDDAVNTANLAIQLMRQGVRYEVTQVSENPLVQQQLGSQGRAVSSAAAAVGARAGSGTEASLGSPVVLGSQVHESAAAAAAAAAAGAVGSSPAGAQGTPSKGRSNMAHRAAQKGLAGVFDASGKWLGRCFCGTKAKGRVTKRPGPNHGRQFWSCGCWTITAQQSSSCDFFMWADEVPAGSLKGAS